MGNSSMGRVGGALALAESGGFGKVLAGLSVAGMAAGAAMAYLAKVGVQVAEATGKRFDAEMKLRAAIEQATQKADQEGLRIGRSMGSDAMALSSRFPSGGERVVKVALEEGGESLVKVLAQLAREGFDYQAINRAMMVAPTAARSGMVGMEDAARYAAGGKLSGSLYDMSQQVVKGLTGMNVGPAAFGVPQTDIGLRVRAVESADAGKSVAAWERFQGSDTMLPSLAKELLAITDPRAAAAEAVMKELNDNMARTHRIMLSQEGFLAEIADRVRSLTSEGSLRGQSVLEHERARELRNQIRTRIGSEP
jgi:hypothetical protein